jgi:tetratricopeptide (TPR) repeat protein
MIDVNTFYVLGLSYSKLNMYKKEEEEFKQAIYLNPKFTKAYVDLAYLYAKQEEYDKAIVEWNKLLEINPDFPEKYNVLYFMGMAYQKKQMPDKALEYFLQAIQLVPEGDPIEQEIEEEINKIYRSNLEN